MKPDDFSGAFHDFARLLPNVQLIGDGLFLRAKETMGEQNLSVITNLVLHASLCLVGLEPCADLLEGLYESFVSESQISLVVLIVNVFPDLSLLPRLLEFICEQHMLSSLPNRELSSTVGQIILGAARRIDQPFEPTVYFPFTLRHKLYKDHAELQFEHGTQILGFSKKPDVGRMTEASSHFLLALAYGLHKKCFSFGMKCLKKLALISLQMEVSEPVFGLDGKEAFKLMKERDIPFALVISIAYDLDTEENWGIVVFEQTILKSGEQWMKNYELFKPMGRIVYVKCVEGYKKLSTVSANVKSRMERLVMGIRNLVQKYEVASELEMNDIMVALKETHPIVCEWCENRLT
jgi:spatacsin